MNCERCNSELSPPQPAELAITGGAVDAFLDCDLFYCPGCDDYFMDEEDQDFLIFTAEVLQAATPTGEVK